MRARQQKRNLDPLPGQEYRPRVAINGASHANRETLNGTGTTASMIGAVQWFMAKAYCPYDIVSYAGIGGQRIQAVINNFSANTLAHDPDILFLFTDCVGNMLGDNNGRTSAQGFHPTSTPESGITGLDTLLNQCYAADIVPVVFTLPPNANCDISQDSDPTFFATSKQMQKFNRLLQVKARNDPRFILVDMHNFQNDLTNADGRYITTTSAAAVGSAVSNSTAWTHDLTHYQPRYAHYLGAVKIFEALKGTRFSTSTIVLPSSNTELYRRIANPTNSGSAAASGTGISGNIATNTLLTATGLTAGTVVASKVRRTDFANAGEWTRLVISGVATATDINYRFSDAGLGAPTDITTGEPLYAVCEFMLNAQPTNMRGAKILLNMTGGVAQTHTGFNTTSASGSNQLADVGPWLQVGVPYLLYTPIVGMPASTTTFTIDLSITRGAVGNLTADVMIGRAAVISAPVVPFRETQITLP